MHSFSFLVFCILYPLISTLHVIDFGEYGNKYYRIRIEPDNDKIYQMSLDPNEYLYIVGSSSVNYELIHLNSNITLDHKIDSGARPYYLLEPTNTLNLCTNNDDCTFNLIISNTASTDRSISIRFNKNLVIEPNKIYSNTIKLRKRRRYGMKVQGKQLPILVNLTPNKNYKKMDIDLYAYSEKKFTTYYFPNRAERNHIHNYQEQLIIVSADSYYQDKEWHFFEIYGSTDSEYADMDYTFQVITNYEPDNLLKKILLIFAFTVASSFICGIFISFFCTFRHQILFCLRVRSTPHRNGASKKQIKKLKVISYKVNMIEDIDSQQCIICLEDYTENEKIRILKCNHNFHVHCSDEWFYLKNTCPLCNQNIADAQNVHNNTHIEMVQLQQDHEELKLDQNELQELQSDATSLIQASLSIEPQITNE